MDNILNDTGAFAFHPDFYCDQCEQVPPGIDDAFVINARFDERQAVGNSL